jgi:hypothetical protein
MCFDSNSNRIKSLKMAKNKPAGIQKLLQNQAIFLAATTNAPRIRQLATTVARIATPIKFQQLLREWIRTAG